jgi:hypothetical protein
LMIWHRDCRISVGRFRFNPSAGSLTFRFSLLSGCRFNDTKF